MTEQIAKLNEVATALDAMKPEQQTPFIQIARGRLDATIKNLQSHVGECAKRQEAKLKVIEEKTAELEQLQKETEVPSQ